MSVKERVLKRIEALSEEELKRNRAPFAEQIAGHPLDGPYHRERSVDWSRVTVPLLSPTVFFAVVVGTILAFQTFGQIHLLTRGGPGDSTNVMTYAIYDSIRGTTPDPSLAAALSIALFLVTLAVTLFQLKVLEKRVHYG
jgi:ABC-type uncharacterized transport system permease subunit